VEYVYTHISKEHLLFRSFQFSHFHQVVQVAVWAKVVPVVAELHPGLGTFSLCVDSLLRDCGKEGSRLFDFHETLSSSFLLQSSPCYARATQHATSLLG
jgi:hypothetical protein